MRGDPAGKLPSSADPKSPLRALAPLPASPATGDALPLPLPGGPTNPATGDTPPLLLPDPGPSPATPSRVPSHALESDRASVAASPGLGCAGKLRRLWGAVFRVARDGGAELRREGVEARVGRAERVGGEGAAEGRAVVGRVGRAAAGFEDVTSSMKMDSSGAMRITSSSVKAALRAGRAGGYWPLTGMPWRRGAWRFIGCVSNGL